MAARRSLVNPLHTLANLLTGIRQGDFSLRARGADAGDPLGAVFLEYNELGEALLAQHVSALEATALLRRIMEEIDVAVFAFDAEERLQLVNRAGERLLGQPEERMIGHTAQTPRPRGGPGAAAGTDPRCDVRWRVRTVGSAARDLPAGWAPDGARGPLRPDADPA